MRLLILSLIFLLPLVGCRKNETADTPKHVRHLDTITAAAIPPGLDNQPLLFSQQIWEKLEAGSLHESRAKHHYNMIGLNNEAIAVGDLALNWGFDSADAASLAVLDAYILAPAKEYVLKRAVTHDMLIIAESHYRPEHRRFTRSLLAGLYDMGYRHLGLENLLPMFGRGDGFLFDSMLVERGYPLASGITGPYAAEPEFGNLIREAITLGFNIFGYERNGSSDSERDLQMAEHIIAYRQAHPQGKIVCHGGWYHAIETDQEKGPGEYWMAYHYKKLTGDDPLTVYQDAMNEKMAEGINTSPYYEYLLENRIEIPFAAVLINGANESWRGPRGDVPFDIITVDPPRRLLYTGEEIAPFGGELLFNLKEQSWFSELEIPFILTVNKSHESSLATPIVSQQFGSWGEIVPIRLPKGEYRIRIIDREKQRNNYNFPE